MQKTNVLLLLTPKTELSCLKSNMNARQALEKMQAHSYMAIPVISEDGEYAGTLTEGDLLRKLVDDDGDIDALEEYAVNEIVRKDYTPAVKVDAKIDVLAKMITEQNFVPVVDDRNILMGIVTRKRVLQELLDNEA